MRSVEGISAVHGGEEVNKLLAVACSIALRREGQSVASIGKPGFCYKPSGCQLNAQWPPAASCRGFLPKSPQGRDPGCQPGRSHEGSNRSLQWFELRNSALMGEVLVLDPGFNVPGLVSAFVSLLAMAIYAINQAGKENDDDDSSPGGGLMQPTS